MDLIMRRSFAPLDEEQITAVERSLNIQFPSQYRRFLSRWNGGKPTSDIFRYGNQSRGGSSMVDWFLGIHNGENNNFVTYMNLYKKRIPSHLIPIAHDPGGNLVCISVAGSDLGTVFFWDHENESPEGQPPTSENLFVVASNFDAFLSQLQPQG